jgi:hypothetical protein
LAVTALQAITTVNRLAYQLSKRLPEYRKRERYYNGEQPLTMTSPEFRSYHADRYEDWSDNWTAVVAEAPVERLEVQGIRPFDPDRRGAGSARDADNDLWRVWVENEADYGSDLAFLDAVVCDRSYALVWGNPDDEATPHIFWEHPSQCIVDHDPETGDRRAGLKIWRDDSLEYATLYLPDEVWKFERRRVASNGFIVVGGDLMPGGWKPRQPSGDETWPLPNPMGEVPLVELPNRPRTLGEPRSDIAGTIKMQDAVNLVWAYLFNAADFASFPQRVVMGADMPKIPVLDENGEVVGEKPVPLEKFAADRIVWLTGKEAKIGEWKAANLEVYTKVLEVAISHIASQTRTPHHYLVGKMANLSAEALKAAETGLVKRTEEKTEHQGRGIREVFRLVAIAQGAEARRVRAIGAGTVLWKDVESRSEAQLADALQKLKDIGFPFEWLAERYGLDPVEVDRVMQMRQSEVEQMLTLGEDLLDRTTGDDEDDVEGDEDVDDAA